MNDSRPAVGDFVGDLRRRVTNQLNDRQKLWLSEVRHGERDWQKRVRNSVLETPAGIAGVVASRTHDCLAAQESNLAHARSTLRASGIEFVELPRRRSEQARLVIPLAQIRRALHALAQLTPKDGWTRECRDQAGSAVSIRRQRQDPDSIAAIVCRRRVVAPNGRMLSTATEDVIVEAWSDLGPRQKRVDGSEHVPGTLHRTITQPRTLVEYFTPEAWEASVAQDNMTVMPDAPDLYEVPGPVDLVYTWVNGADPSWQTRKARAQAEINGEDINQTAVSASRFTDRNELLYSLRSVEAYASWCHHIYLVTDSQVPQWLETDHPRITVVDHRDIFAKQDDLPVFNSHAIESQLHHIPGLSEHYLYMNDDLFFMRPTGPELFFTGSGLSRFFPSAAPLDLAEPSSKDLPVLSAAKHGREFMLDVHGRRVANKFKHTPHPQLRSVMDDFENTHQAMFDTVARSKFRHPDDYSIASALYHFHAYAQGKAIDSPIRYAYMDISRSDAELYMRRLLRRQDLDVLCLNDTDSSPESHKHLDEIVKWFLNEKFPLPSTFEKQGTAIR